MKLLAALFFSMATPITIFLGTIVYGGLTNTMVKDQFRTTEVYENIGSFIQTAAPDESESEDVIAIVKTRLTPEFIQQKTESSIDDSFSYITGSSTTQPVLSLREIKDDLNAADPAILKEIEHMSIQMDEMNATEESETSDDTVVQSSPEAEFLGDLIKHDFTLPYGEKLDGLKQTHQVLSFAVPILILLELGSLMLLVLQNHTRHAWFRWLGIAFIGAGIAGFIMTLGTSALVVFVVQLLSQYTNEAATIFAPLLMALVTHIVDTYARYQVMANYAFFLTGGICFVGMFATKDQKVEAPKSLSKK